MEAAISEDPLLVGVFNEILAEPTKDPADPTECVPSLSQRSARNYERSLSV